MLDFWYELPPVLLAVAGSVLVGRAVLMFLAGIRNRVTVITGVVGLVCVLFAKTGQDDSGYNF